jgi:ATP adenylyltransferase
MAYIEQTDKVDGCVFCILTAEDKDEQNLILYRGKHAFVILNCFPYNNGHMMVAPFKHTADMCDLCDEELLEINHLVRYCVRLLSCTMQPDGYNLGLNLGRTAGAGIVGHIHWHIVPRWNGDSNFMPVIGNTKVLPESLLATYDKLKAQMKELGEPD